MFNKKKVQLKCVSLAHSTLSNNTALGPNGIRYCELCMLMDGEMEQLCKTFNISIETGISEDWLHSYLVPVPKPGRGPHADPGLPYYNYAKYYRESA